MKQLSQEASHPKKSWTKRSNKCVHPEYGHPRSHHARPQTGAGCQGPPGQIQPQSLHLTRVEAGVAP